MRSRTAAGTSRRSPRPPAPPPRATQRRAFSAQPPPAPATSAPPLTARRAPPPPAPALATGWTGSPRSSRRKRGHEVSARGSRMRLLSLSLQAALRRRRETAVERSLSQTLTPHIRVHTRYKHRDYAFVLRGLKRHTRYRLHWRARGRLPQSQRRVGVVHVQRSSCSVELAPWFAARGSRLALYLLAHWASSSTPTPAQETLLRRPSSNCRLPDVTLT